MPDRPPEEFAPPNDAPPPRPGVKQLATHLQRFFTETIWFADLASMPRARAILYRVLRVLSLATRGYFRDECSFRASALTYTTVLSIVPVLAFGFAMAKGLGFYETLRTETINPFLDNTFGPVPQPASEDPAAELPSAADSGTADAAAAKTQGVDEDEGPTNVRGVIVKILDFVEGTKVTALGTIGALILLYTILKLLGTIERSFNDIWGIKRQRQLVRKVADYLTLVIITPIFLFTATTLTAAAQANAFVAFLSEDLKLKWLIELLLRFTPVFAMWLGFTFLYLVMPNTRTKFSSALIGGIVGGTLWQIAQVAHVKFQIGIANYSALYSTFAAFPIFLVWLYLSWVIVLVGAELAAAHQNESLHERAVRTKVPPHILKEILSLRALKRIAEAFVAALPPLTSSDLANRLGYPEPIIEQVMGRLAETGIVAPIGDDRDTAYVPARDLDTITVKNVLDALKGGEGVVVFPPADRADDRAETVLKGIDGSIERSEFNLTLRELIASGGNAAAQAGGERAARTLPPQVAGGGAKKRLRGSTAAAEEGS
jgi:membrane protein